ncbi:MAG: RNA polymerase factor sigma-54 [Arcicella sp.]|jgi:RNA polymerase sigma-54 factor|nr:RNA polymerase factor sigma-54 [Arcicella sp.]
MNLSQTQRQTFKITPLQIQMLNFLQLSTVELEARIKNELEENPLLEEGTPTVDEVSLINSDDQEESANESEYVAAFKPEKDYADWDEYLHDDTPDYKLTVSNKSTDDEIYTAPIVQENDWRTELKNQAHFLPLTERQVILMDFVIDSLDDNGFLMSTAEGIADDVSFTNNMFVDYSEVHEILAIIRLMEPTGIGATDLQDCLMMQLQRKKEQGFDVALAVDIVAFNFEELTNHNYEKIMRQREISADELKKAIAQITALNAKPFTEGSEALAIKNNIIPDYIITYETNLYGELSMEISLNNGRVPALKINQGFAANISAVKDKAATQYVNSKLDAANWLIRAIHQRENTMLEVMKTIVVFQKDFFKTGDIQTLRPMILKNIADVIGMDISTVSRVTSGKYAQTPFGIIHLKALFTEGIKIGWGEEVSNREIQEAMVSLIAKEDKKKPLNDFQIMDLLARQGYKIARRTVAKYRENLNILSAQMRRTL